jgi:hypothetical protein
MERLMRHGHYHGVATRDERLIDVADDGGPAAVK